MSQFFKFVLQAYIMIFKLQDNITIILFFFNCSNENDSSNILNENNSDSLLTDIDGNTYKTIKIGDQIWTAENLRTTKLNDGTPIEKMKDVNEWRSLKTPAYCYYNKTNDQDSITKIFLKFFLFSVDTDEVQKNHSVQLKLKENEDTIQVNSIELLMSDNVKPHADGNKIDYIQSMDEEGFIVGKPGQTGCEGCSC